MYNPLAWNISTYVNVSVSYAMAVVLDDNGKAVPAQVTQNRFIRHTVYCVHHIFFLSFGLT